MRHDSVVSRYAIPIGIPQVDGWSTGPPGFGVSHIFSFSCIQLCNPVGPTPTIPSPPNQTPNIVLIITVKPQNYYIIFLYILNI